jgi:hypothetical protein
MTGSEWPAFVALGLTVFSLLVTAVPTVAIRLRDGGQGEDRDNGRSQR